MDEQYHGRIVDVIAMKNTLYYEDIKKAEARGMEIGEERKEHAFRIQLIKNLLGKVSNLELAKSLGFTEEELDKFIRDNDLSPYSD